jgi:hypothetical protein
MKLNLKYKYTQDTIFYKRPSKGIWLALIGHSKLLAHIMSFKWSSFYIIQYYMFLHEDGETLFKTWLH